MTFPVVILRTNKVFRQLSDSFIGHVFDPNKDLVLITGGCSGLGKALVTELSKKGAKIIVLDIKIPLPESPEISDDNVTYYKCDVGDLQQLLSTKAKIDEDFPKNHVTMLINNAGYMHGKPLIELEFTEIENTIKVNLLSNFYLNKIFLPQMLESKRGYIVTIASVLGYMSPAWLSAYGASKSGVIALHESLTYELGPPSTSPKGVKTLLIAPGQLRTTMFNGVKTPSRLLAPELDPVVVARIIIDSISIGRRGEIKLPFYGNFLPLFRALPWRITEVVRHFSGIDTSMVNYRKFLKESSAPPSSSRTQSISFH